MKKINWTLILLILAFLAVVVIAFSSCEPITRLAVERTRNGRTTYMTTTKNGGLIWKRQPESCLWK